MHALRRWPFTRDTTQTVGILVLVLASVVSWRRGVLYSGGTDPVVVAKAAVAVLALLCAAVRWRSAPVRRPLTPFPTLLVIAIVGIALVGAVQAGTLTANLVLTVRIALLATTLVLVMATTTTEAAFTAVLAAMAAIGLVAAGTGAVAMLLHLGGAHHGRLAGGIPPLAPNELATLVLPPAIGLLSVVVRRGLRPAPTAALVVLAGIILASGSRVALAMLGVAALIIVLRERRLTTGVAVVALLSLLAGYVVVMFSSALTQLTLRGQGTGQLLTLNSRTISWQAVLGTSPTTWGWWIGNGLSMKSIGVVGQYWTTQVFDSSWISSIAQDGVLGTVLLAVYVLVTLVAVIRRRSLGSAVLAVTVTIAIRSFFENGLIESSATFALFFVIALGSWPGTDRPARAAGPGGGSAADRVLRVPEWEALVPDAAG